MILSRIFSPGERRELTVAPKLLKAILSGASLTPTAAAVNADNAQTVAAVFAAVRIIANSIAAMPLNLMERTAAGRVRASGHPLYSLLRALPNPETTAVELVDFAVTSLLLHGNAYAQIIRNGAGRVVELWPLMPERVEVARVARGELAGQLAYFYWHGGEYKPLNPGTVWHVRGYPGNGLTGTSPIKYARQSIGLAIRAEQYGATFFENDATPGMVLEYPGQLDDATYQNLVESWESRHQGPGASRRVAILEEGLTAKSIGVAPDDAQFLQTRQYQVNEVARWFGVPPHMLADLERATFSNIEHQSINFVTHTLQPWLVRIEQAITRDLLAEGERGRFYANFNVAGLLRGDIGARYAAYAIGRQWGWLSANDVRELEDLNAIPGGETYLTPLNMIDAAAGGERAAAPAVELAGQLVANGHGQPAPVPAVANGHGQPAGAIYLHWPPAAPDERAEGGQLPQDERRAIERRAAAGGRQRLQRAHRPLFIDAIKRILNREATQVGAAARRLLAGGVVAAFEKWLDDYYRNDLPPYIERTMAPVLESYAPLIARAVADELGEAPRQPAPAFMAGYLATFAARYGARHGKKLRKVLDAGAGELDDAVVAMLEDWRADDARATVVGDEESVRANNALAVAIYGAMGRTAIVWVDLGESCPYCEKLNGRTVGLNENFLGAGDTLEGLAGAVLTVSYAVGHPPAHGGCDCMVVSA